MPIYAAKVSTRRVAVLARTERPVINHPRAVLKTGRAGECRAAARPAECRSCRGWCSCRAVCLPAPKPPRPSPATAFRFRSWCARRVSTPGVILFASKRRSELAAAVAQFPGDDVWLIEQLDARDGDGMFRKFRVMIIDRKIYPLHLAISRHWKVHYFKADMADSPDKSRHDAAFLDDMASVIGPRGMAALERISAALDLDYGGIDFAVNADGDILLFEANATMVMVPLATDPKWAYRRPAFDAVFSAVRTMLLDRAGSRTGRMAARA